MSDKKYAAGTPVTVSGVPCVVVEQGRDGAGIYTLVRYEDERQERVHRSMVKPREVAE